MAAAVPHTIALDEARRFVGTQLERRFNTRQYRGWYPATVAEVNLGSDLGLEGQDADRLWCLLRYQPEEEGEEGDAEDQPWHFVFHSPTDCRCHRLPSTAQDWLLSPAAAAGAAAEAPAAAAAAAEGAEVAQALVAVQQAGAVAEAQQAAEQQGVLAEPPLPPLPAEHVHKPKRRRRATTTVGGRQPAAAEHCSNAGLPSSPNEGAPRMPSTHRSQRKPASGLPAAAAGEGPPAIGGGGGATAGLHAASEHQLTQAEVAAALQQAGALQGAEPSQPLVPAQPSPAAPAPTAQAPLATPAAELRTPQAQPQVPATQQQEGQAQQQQEQQQPQGHMAQQPPQPPKLPQQPPVQAQASAEPPQWQPAAAAGWGQLMDRLARVVQGCVAAGLVDQGTAWKYRLKANRPGGFTEEQLAVEVQVMEDIAAAEQLEAAAEAIHAFVARG